MTKLVKLFEKFLLDPVSLKLEKVEKILLLMGCEKVYTKGSHVKFKHVLAQRDLIIPVHHGDCKSFYKKLALKFVKEHNLIAYYENSSKTEPYC